MRFSVFSPVPRMMLNDFASQTISVNMCVNFGSTDTFVSQHALDDTQIGTSFQQMSCKLMSEGVRTDFFF
jgi:hypothetical protein